MIIYYIKSYLNNQLKLDKYPAGVYNDKQKILSRGITEVIL